MENGSCTTKTRSALVLYGSETGNAQDVAEEVGRLLIRYRFRTTVRDLDSVQLRDLLRYTLVVFAISTTGQGEFTQNARGFWKLLLSAALKPAVLRRLAFSSFGLGDSSYAKFNIAHRLLYGRLVGLGANVFCERGEGNEQHPEGHSAGLREWMIKLREALQAKFPLPATMEPLPEDAFIEPAWSLGPISPIQHGERSFRSKSTIDEGGDQEATPSQALLPVRNSHVATISSNSRITASDHFQDVRVLDLRLGKPLSYGPGAVAVIYPKNFPADVQAFIDLMGWNEYADMWLTLEGNESASTDLSPLRNFDLQGVELTLRWLLENVIDFMAIPRRTFFSNLLHFVDSTKDDDNMQKDRLVELSNSELIDELWDYTTRPKRTILEVMRDFTAAKIPWRYCLSALPLMRGRQFSIASGGYNIRDGDNGTKIELLVAIADPPSPIIKSRRYGICTRYITTLQAAQRISIGLQPGYLDVQPDEINVPVVLIGPGTGLAPMRSLVQQRLAWAQGSISRASGGRLASDILLFGCRSSTADHFFASEWDRLQNDEALTVMTAFSRDSFQPRRYVQDLMSEHAGMIKQALVDRQGKLYISGSSGNMPKGVRQALIDLISKECGMDQEAAERYTETMEREGRYKQETW
ncbi:NADPH-dependent FMN/FAD containing oxidoreductase [Polychaeton citri CBS 116435]|uniref:NADPH-dependent diflavin oxidoreductase 1 n=1 Tax=Polychaeton citri CBS 116435 TaxID=1314669 RepID=A0A9P4Q6W9_9PEZI|nr:NADPH-dependent FMN/FAD containing oxidoreductase [Polychaeton citri CBS 116435]